MFGTVYNIGYAELAKEIEKIKSNYEPNTQPKNFYSFQRIDFSKEDMGQCTSQDGRDLLSIVRIERKLIPYEQKEAPYIFTRTLEEQLIIAMHIKPWTMTARKESLSVTNISLNRKRFEKHSFICDSTPSIISLKA